MVLCVSKAPHPTVYDLLERVALEVEQQEKELGPRRGKPARRPAAAKGALALPSIVGALQTSGSQQALPTGF